MAKEGTVGERLAKFLVEYRAGAAEALPGSVPGGGVIDLGRTAFKLGDQYFALSPVRRIPDYETVAPGSPGAVDAGVRGAVSKVIARALTEYACHMVHYATFPWEGGRNRVAMVLACRSPEKAGGLTEQARRWLEEAGALVVAIRHGPEPGTEAAAGGAILQMEVEW